MLSMLEVVAVDHGPKILYKILDHTSETFLLSNTLDLHDLLADTKQIHFSACPYNIPYSKGIAESQAK
jgi:hypothetical protein